MNLIKILLCSYLSVMSLNGFAQVDADQFLNNKMENPEDVYILYVDGRELKELPDVFGTLKNLNSFDAYDNQISGLPPSFAELKELTMLNLGLNNLNEFPKEILSLKNLTFLDLGENPISSIPKDLKDMQQLTNLYLYGLELKEFPEAVCALQNLKTLNISKNQISSLPPCLANLKSLETLIVSENNFDHFPEVILDMKSLSHLDIEQKNQFDFPQNTAQIKTLTHVYINEDYYQKNKKSLHNLLPNAKINPPLPPPPTIIETDVIMPEINEVSANEYCFNFTEKIKKGDLVSEFKYTLEFNDFSNQARLTKESSEYDEKKKLEAEKEGYTIVSSINIELSDGVYEKKDGNLIYIPENAEKQTFKITYDSDKKKIKELKDSKKQVWKPGECYAPPPSVGF